MLLETASLEGWGLTTSSWLPHQEKFLANTLKRKVLVLYFIFGKKMTKLLYIEINDEMYQFKNK